MVRNSKPNKRKTALGYYLICYRLCYIGMMVFSLGLEGHAMENKRRPSVDEFEGIFNLNKNDHSKSPYSDEEVLCTASSIPDLTRDEQVQVLIAVADTIKTSGKSIFVPLLDYPNPAGPKDFLIVQHDVDRTISIEWSSHSIVTLNVIEGIKNVLAHDFPLWRVILFGRSKMTKIAIYADCVQFHSSLAGDGLAGKLKRAMDFEQNEFDNTVGLKLKQHTHVEKNFKKRFNAIQTSMSPQIVFHFDRYALDEGDSVFWVFHRMSSCFDIELLNESYAFSKAFEVSSTGELAGLYDLGDDCFGYLIEVVVKKKLLGDTVIIRDEQNVQKQWRLAVPQISDNDI